VAEDLAGLLGAIRAEGLTVQDVRVEAPSLHAVFLHLTGRELRE
jgi:ABC-2 type transport system ATP-binding protein